MGRRKGKKEREEWGRERRPWKRRKGKYGKIKKSRDDLKKGRDKNGRERREKNEGVVFAACLSLSSVPGRVCGKAIKIPPPTLWF